MKDDMPEKKSPLYKSPWFWASLAVAFPAGCVTGMDLLNQPDASAQQALIQKQKDFAALPQDQQIDAVVAKTAVVSCEEKVSEDKKPVVRIYRPSTPEEARATLAQPGLTCKAVLAQ